jgi:protein SCO1/2
MRKGTFARSSRRDSMRPGILKQIRVVLWFAMGLLALVYATLFGPDFFPLSVPAPTSAVYLTKPFELVDENGRKVTEEDFRGKPTAWFFGFTHCADVCPTTLSDLTMTIERLGPDAEKLNLVFLTVDPERDTPEVLKAYLSSFDPRIIGLTGSRAAIEAVAKSYFIHQAKVPLRDGGYTTEHTSKVLLTAADGRFVGTMDHQEPIESQVRKLRHLGREG